MGGKKSGGARTPYEAPNTLHSAQSLRMIDVIGEGEIAGLAHGDDAPFKSVYFDDTPVQNSDGSFNFKGVSAFFQRGTLDQSYIPHFDVSERTVSVSANVKHHTPIIRAITDNTINRLRVTVGVQRNVQVQENGDSVAAHTEMLIELLNQQGIQTSKSVVFNEKGSGDFYYDVVLDSLPKVPFNLRVSRVSADSTTDKLANSTFFASYVEITDVKLSYPHTALIALKIDSDQFGNSIPRRNYLIKGKLVQVPSNYNPETRQYSGSLWDGSFKWAWTNNPAWIFYDLLTNPRYSTLARRLMVADIDKWSLYQVAQYCDELVPDGLGGEEPRFVCNAYITDQRQAAELLNDLASVFCGLVIWNGNQISVILDKNTDPIAQYTNANVVNGEFTYSGAALKGIHTAVHVQYADKYDGYRSKIEYVSDDHAISQYGLNIKQVTAFGCDSRGQAARFGQWILQTELRQQNTVSFSVGREGLKHLPYDIIQIADNDYAGIQSGGRVVAVSGNLITLDRDVKNAVGAKLFIASGSLNITAQPKPNQIQTATTSNVAIDDVWAMSGKVKTRLYRAISIKENTNDGTYTITALLHDPAKYGAVDHSVIFDNAVNTLHSSTPTLRHADIEPQNGGLTLSWDSLSTDGNVLDYEIKVYRNNELYRQYHSQTAELQLDNLSNGRYRAEIRARNARGVYSKPLIKEWTIDYTINALRANPKTLAIELVWTLPELLTTAAHTEIWYATENQLQAARKLASLPTPQHHFVLTSVSVSERLYFWARLVDENGNTGEWTKAILGQADPNPAPIVAQIHGAIEKSSLSNTLINQLKADDAAAEVRAKADTANKIAAESTARSAAIRAESEARANAIRAETTARNQAIQAAANTQANNLNNEINRLNAHIQATATTAQTNLTAQVNALTAKDNELKQASDRLASRADELTRQATALGNRIQAAETINAQQAQSIQTITASNANTAAALETEKRARTAADQAEANARNTLATKVNQNTATIEAERTARTSAQTAETRAREQLSARLDNLSIGGRNLLLGTAKMVIGSGAWVSGTFRVSFPANGRLETVAVQDSPVAGVSQAIKITTISNICGFAQDARPIQAGWFVMSVWVKGVAGAKVKLQPFWSNQNQNVPTKDFVLTSDSWVRLTFAGENKVAGNTSLGYVYLYHQQGDGELYVLAPKLEIGNLQTDWTPAPEDGDKQISAVQADLQTERTARVAADQAESRAREALASSVANNTAAINAERTARANADQAEANARNTLATKVNQNTAAIEAERIARTSAQTAETRAREQLSARVATAESGLTAERTARTAADTAQTSEINAAKTRLGNAESGLNTLRTTVSSQNQALTQAQTTLTARLDNLQIGGRNHIKNSDFSREWQGWVNWGTGVEKSVNGGMAHLQTTTTTPFRGIAQTIQGLQPNTTYIIAFTAKSTVGNKVVMGMHYRSANQTTLSQAWFTFDVSESMARYHKVLTTPNHADFNQIYLMIGGKQNAPYDVHISKIQLEQGNIPTDWRPAPEDLASATEAVQAALTAHQTAQAAKDEAQTVEINNAKSRLGTAESGLNNLRTTKADKGEVASLARTTLQSEWRNDVNTAKNAAIADAQVKADAAKQAAITAADHAATAKANAAKAEAIASANATAQSKADAAKAAAIADAAAKDAVLKQQAATDAQHKADAAKAAAIADATTKINAANAKITALETTVSSQNSATASQINTLQAALNSDPDNLCRNPSCSENTTGWNGLGRETVDGVVVGLASNRDAYYGAWLPARAGDAFFVSAWVKRKDSQHRIKIGIFTRRADNHNTFNWLHGAFVWAADGSAWQKMSGYVVIPSECEDARLWVQVEKTAGVSGSWYIRDIEFRRANAVETARQALAAELTAEREARTTADTAQTTEMNTAKTRLGAAESSISTLRGTKADKGEVASIARTTLQSEWRNDVNTAKNQVATDAQHKADAAKQAAITDANSKIHAATAKITALETTVSNQHSATTTQINNLNSRLDNAVVGGRNYFVRRSAVNQFLTETGELRNADAGNMTSDFIAVKGGMSLIYQIWVTVSSIPQSWSSWCFYDANRRLIGARTVVYGERRTETPFEWHQKILIQVPDNARFIRVGSRYLQNGNAKLEIGTLATDWSPATEDLDSQINEVQAALTAERTARTAADTAQTSEINAAKARLGNAESSLNTLRTTVSNNQNATTSQINSLNSRFGTAEANIRTAQTATTTLNGKVQALHTVKVETVAGGKKVMAGLALGADGATGEAQVNVHAQKFSVWDGAMLKPVFAVVTHNGRTQTAISGDLIADGTILGKHLAASQTINAPTISGGTISGSLIRGARMEAVDLQATNIIGDVVAARTFTAENNRLICRIDASRKTARTLVIPQIWATAEDGQTVTLQIWLDGKKLSEKTITSPSRNVAVRKNVQHRFHTPAVPFSARVDGTRLSGTIPSATISGRIDGTSVSGWVSGNVSGQVGDNVSGHVSGWVNGGNVSGNVSGRVGGNVSGNVGGQVSGQTQAATVSGQTQAVQIQADIPSSEVRGNIPSQLVLLDFNIDIDLPYTLPKSGGISLTRQIDGAAHTLELVSLVGNTRNLAPLGDVSGAVCFVI